MNFEYTIKKSKGKSIRISINKYGGVFLHVPRFVPQFVAKRFLLSKRKWVEKSLAKIHAIPNPLLQTRGKVQEKKHYSENKENARTLVREKLEYWKNYYQTNFQINFLWKKVAIKNTKTRWGSCSSKKNLNFTYRIINLSENTQNYLIVHELCHLIEMNHSRNFWKLVSLGVPDYLAIRKELKGVGLQY